MIDVYETEEQMGRIVEVTEGPDAGMRGMLVGSTMETLWIEMSEDDTREYPRTSVKAL